VKINLRWISGTFAAVINMAIGQAQAGTFPVVHATSADVRCQWAARELSGFLRLIHAEDTFPIVNSIPADGDFILLGTAEETRSWSPSLQVPEVDAQGGFAVRHIHSGGREVGVICGNDYRAVVDGVYALLQQNLGHGFYLHANASEAVMKGPFSFVKWDMSAHPLVQERVCFNWYNFISGVSAWNLQDYQDWIRQASRMRYNEVMLHTYGWGPFTQFTHNGVTKPVGYLQNTAHGSHWGVKHTPDVRRLIGGEVFADEGPVFGADAGKIGYGGVTEENRVALAKAMLRQAMDYAVNTVGMEFNWSFDIDTTYGNPQNIIVTLPEQARIRVGKCWLARPDTGEGYLFFRKIMETTMRDFPAITKITVWWRGGSGNGFGGLVNTMKPSDLPPAWLEEYKAAPMDANNAYGPGHLYHSKVAQAFRRALDELGHSQVKLAYGSWWNKENALNFMAANHFMPRGMPCYALDYDMVFGESLDYRNQLSKTAGNRPLVVMEWAQHDDGKYMGRPCLPPADFASKLRETGASGCGVLHWSTRPLDLYFKSISNQVWSDTANEPLSTTCQKMALDFFGSSQSTVMAEYLHEWMTTAPIFGRETGDRLDGDGVGGAVKDFDLRVQDCDRRIAILDRVDAGKLSDAALRRWKFFKGHEEWIRLFHLAQKTRDPELRKQAILKYAEMASVDGGMTRGEKGLLIQHNLKWLNDLGNR